MTRWFGFLSLVAFLFAATPAFASTTDALASSFTGALVDPSLSLESQAPKAVEKITAKGQLQQCGLTQDQKECDVVIVRPSRGLGLVVGLLLNIFLPFAIGSWVTGDILGGALGLGAQLIGIVFLILSGVFIFGPGYIFWIVGWILVTIGYLVPIGTVVFHHLGRGGPRYRRHRDYGELNKEHNPMARAFQTPQPAVGFSF